jgi:hypothetical protein
MTSFLRFITGSIVITIAVLSSLGCDKPQITGQANPNMPPETYLANVPTSNDSVHPYPYRLAFSWDGGDEDGVVVGFEYRWDERAWTYTELRSDSFDFESPDLLNRHIFEVRAVDNLDARDPTPASRIFFTRQTELPETAIVSGPS